jgi:hypothetical protein
MTFDVPSLRNADRIAVDHSGRVWGVRYTDATLSSGLLVDVGAEEAVVVAPLPPLPAGDFVDALVLVGQPEMWTLPGGATLPLRTPVVRSAQGRLFVYVWWTSSENYQFDSNGDVSLLGTIGLTPGWYQLVTTTSVNNLSLALGSRVLAPTPDAGPLGNMLTLSHVILGSNVRTSALLRDDGVTTFMPVHAKACLNGAPVFGLFPFVNSGLPSQEEFPIHTGTGGFWGPRSAWSPKHYVTQAESESGNPLLFPINPDNPILGQFAAGPFIFGRIGTPQIEGYDNRGDWTLVPSNSPEDFYEDIEFEGGLYDVYAPFQLSAWVDKNTYLGAVYKVVSADRPFANWEGGDDVALWVLTGAAHVWGIQISPPAPTSSPRRIDPWPSLVTEESGFRSVQDPTWGTVYEKLNAGYTELPTEPLTTEELPLPRERLALEVFVPSSATGWIGDVQMTFELAAAGISEQYVGYAGLTQLPRGAWSTVTFDLPSAWRQALLGDFPGARFRTFVNTSAGGVRVGGLRFDGNVTPGQRAPHQPVLEGVRTTPELDFETEPGWTGPKVERARVASSGLRAARVNSSGWTELLSPSFLTNSLPAVGTKLNVDVYMPTPSPESHWQGDIQAFLTCENTSVQNAWIAWSSLQNLFSNEYNTITLGMPQSIQAALQVPGRTCKFRLTANTAPTSSAASFYVDRVGFSD